MRQDVSELRPPKKRSPNRGFFSGTPRRPHLRPEQTTGNSMRVPQSLHSSEVGTSEFRLCDYGLASSAPSIVPTGRARSPRAETLSRMTGNASSVFCQEPGTPYRSESCSRRISPALGQPTLSSIDCGVARGSQSRESRVQSTRSHPCRSASSHEARLKQPYGGRKSSVDRSSVSSITVLARRMSSTTCLGVSCR
jgi:hypothetical protein